MIDERRPSLPTEEFTPDSMIIMSHTYGEAWRLRHAVADTEHLLLGFISAQEDEKYRGENILELIGANPHDIKTVVESLNLEALAGICGSPEFSQDVKNAISGAFLLARKAGVPVNERHLFLGVLMLEGTKALGILRMVGIDRLEAIGKLRR